MIILAVRRQRMPHGRWLMIISGAGSVFAGISFTGWTGSPSAGLTALARYSAGGAVWCLLTALWLSLRVRLTPGRPASGAGTAALVAIVLRWVLMHLVEETARHNGHIDILREMTDGQTGR